LIAAGYDGVFPRLAGNPVVEAPNPVSLISIVLTGSQTPRIAQTPARFAMPVFAWRLSDQNVADLVNFIRSSWGNSASARLSLNPLISWLRLSLLRSPKTEDAYPPIGGYAEQCLQLSFSETTPSQAESRR
jgi:hypothetical protein